jgi:hypothetical protein
MKVSTLILLFFIGLSAYGQNKGPQTQTVE